MRFSVATAAILSQAALPVCLSQRSDFLTTNDGGVALSQGSTMAWWMLKLEQKNGGKKIKNDKVGEQSSLLPPPPPPLPLPSTTTPSQISHEEPSMASLFGRLKNRHHQQHRDKKKNPLEMKRFGKTHYECNPDTGLLACGVGRYCMADDQSSLGGVCSFPIGGVNRRLDQSGTATPPDSGYLYCEKYGPLSSCNCDSWDPSSDTGSLTCLLYDNYCSYNCNGLCWNAPLTYYNDGEDWGYTVCYNFFSPYEQSFCLDYFDDQTCIVSLDGEPCTVCDMSTECGYLNCVNVGMGKGDFCDNPVLSPILSTCLGDSGSSTAPPYEPCYLCSGGSGVDYPTNYVNLPYYGPIQCSSLSLFAESGEFLNSTECLYLSNLVQSECCQTVDSTLLPTESPTEPSSAPMTSPPTAASTEEEPTSGGSGAMNPWKQGNKAELSVLLLLGLSLTATAALGV